MLLVTEGLTKKFGGLVALNGVDLRVDAGEVCVIIGPNGSGKTTFFNLVSGVMPPTHGRVLFDGVDVTGVPSWRLARMGISRTFQTIRLFRSLSVLENVLVARYARSRSGLWEAILGTGGYRARDRRNREVAGQALEMCGLESESSLPAIGLPYGKQRRLEIARALATEPKLLLLDEPAAGMNHAEIEDMIQLIFRLRDRGISVLLIEHQMQLAMSVTNHMVVFESGTKLAEGNPEEIRSDQRVVEAYLGTEYA